MQYSLFWSVLSKLLYIVEATVCLACTASQWGCDDAVPPGGVGAWGQATFCLSEQRLFATSWLRLSDDFGGFHSSGACTHGILSERLAYWFSSFRCRCWCLELFFNQLNRAGASRNLWLLTLLTADSLTCLPMMTVEWLPESLDVDDWWWPMAICFTMFYRLYTPYSTQVRTMKYIVTVAIDCHWLYHDDAVWPVCIDCFGFLWQVIHSTNYPADIDAFNAGGYLQSVALPVAKIGHGNSDVTGKYEAVFSSVKLDVSPAQHLSNLLLNDSMTVWFANVLPFSTIDSNWLCMFWLKLPKPRLVLKVVLLPNMASPLSPTSLTMEQKQSSWRFLRVGFGCLHGCAIRQNCPMESWSQYSISQSARPYFQFIFFVVG